MNNRFTIIIFGPTGVGKTDFAEHIARYIPAEIINMDMGQLYVPFTIGTAKPDWHTATVPHHLFDIIDEPRSFSVAEYRKRVLLALEDVWARGRVPLLVGGSGFYLRSLFFPPQAAPATRQAPLPYAAGTDLWQELYAIDPERAALIDKNDRYRIERALAIWHTTGEKPSLYVPNYESISPFFLFYLTRERSQLYERINLRVDQMLADGWLEEVSKVQGTAWETFILNKKLIGYDDLVHYLHSERTQKELEKTIQIIKKRTRNYAKRQHTYWKMLKKELEKSLAQVHPMSGELQSKLIAIDLTATDIDLYIKKLLTGLPVKKVHIRE